MIYMKKQKSKCNKLEIKRLNKNNKRKRKRKKR